jgi:Tfp pilus assembly protein PilZ
MPELLLTFENRAALTEEFEKNLAHGRAFVAGSADLAVFSACTLTLEHPDTRKRLSLGCEVVMVLDQGKARGTGLQFVDRSDQNIERVRTFIGEQVAPSEAVRRAPLATPFDDNETTGVLTMTTGQQPPSDDANEGAGETDELDDLDEETNPFGASSADEHPPGSAQHAIVAARAAKLRNLTAEQRIHYARSSVQEERVLLERLYGSAVWDLLLHNPKVTVPEVARMARKGSMPRPLLDFISDNEQWIRHSLVRRALLANPRLTGDAITRVLRALPPRELKLVPQQTAYPPAVRQAAARLMKG